MRASSSLLTLVPRPASVPRPRRVAAPVAAAAPAPAEVLAYLAKLTAAERLDLLARAEVQGGGLAPDPSPGELGPPRPTLLSADLEVLYGTPALRSTVPPPLPQRARRVVAPVGPHDAVVASMADLPLCESAAEAASVCVVAAMRVVPSLAGLALLQDTGRGDFVVVHSRGPRAGEIVRGRVGEDDALLGTARLLRAPAAIEYGVGRSPAGRHAVFGEPWTVLVVPCLDGGRYVAALELVDPIDGTALGESERGALAAIAGRLTDFCRERRVETGQVFSPAQVGLDD